MAQKVDLVRQLENEEFGFFPRLFYAKLGGKMGTIPWCFPGNSESGDATMITLTSQGPKGLFSRTFWFWDEKTGTGSRVTEAIRWKSQGGWLPCCLLVYKWIELNRAAEVRDGGSGWADLGPLQIHMLKF